MREKKKFRNGKERKEREKKKRTNRKNFEDVWVL
jgi:hypothetical protein